MITLDREPSNRATVLSLRKEDFERGARMRRELSGAQKQEASERFWQEQMRRERRNKIIQRWAVVGAVLAIALITAVLTGGLK